MARLVANNMKSMLAGGFTERMAHEYLEILSKEKDSGLFNPAYLNWAHERGFFGESAYAFDLKESNIDNYLSDYDYYRVWPLNSWRRVWINDKLTLKYMLQGSQYEAFMPKYFFYADRTGVIPLMDAGEYEGDQGFLSCLEDKGEFACKPANAELAAGFHKLSYVSGNYYIDNEPSSKQGILEYLSKHTNDVFTEFLHPGMGLDSVSPVIHTLRVLTINPRATTPELVAAYLRFAAGTNGNDAKANYFPPENAETYSFNVDVDLETGSFGDGRIVFANKVINSNTHPETMAEATGMLPTWDEMRQLIEGVAKYLAPVEYMGFDVCFSSKGPKLIEINSHSGSKYLQLYRPFMSDEILSAYFSEKLEQLQALNPEEIAQRNSLQR